MINLNEISDKYASPLLLWYLQIRFNMEHAMADEVAVANQVESEPVSPEIPSEQIVVDMGEDEQSMNDMEEDNIRAETVIPSMSIKYASSIKSYCKSNKDSAKSDTDSVRPRMTRGDAISVLSCHLRFKYPTASNVQNHTQVWCGLAHADVVRVDVILKVIGA